MGNPNNFFTDKLSFKTIDTFRITYFITFITTFILTEIGRYIYRPYIYSNNIDDFGIADSMGNSGGIIVQIFFGLTLLNPPKNKAPRIIVFLTFGYIVYEILQSILPKGTFDWLDIYGTLIGGVLASILFLIIRLLVRNNHIIHRFLRNFKSSSTIFTHF